MYARVVTVQVQPGRTGDMIEIFRDTLVPVLRQESGFCGAQLLTDAASGRAQMMTRWESEAQMRANEESGWFREQLARFQAVLSAPPSAERYQVSVTTD